MPFRPVVLPLEGLSLAILGWRAEQLTLGWEKARLSQHLTRMQNRGLIRREPCPTDQRGAVVVITERGRALIEEAARSTWPTYAMC